MQSTPVPSHFLPTVSQYTNHYSVDYIELYWYNSRWYDPALGRFAQADTVIPDATQGIQAWDRYAYVNNNPLRFIDPTRHYLDDGCDWEGCSLPYPKPYNKPKPMPTPGPENIFTPEVSATPSPFDNSKTVNEEVEICLTPIPGEACETVKVSPLYLAEIRMNKPNPDWFDVTVDGIGLVGDLAAFFAPGPGYAIEGGATLIEIVAFSRHIDAIELGEASGIADSSMDVVGMLLDGLRVPPYVGAVFSLIDIASNFSPGIQIYVPSY
jgi:RHS repeat-associated protein